MIRWRLSCVLAMAGCLPFIVHAESPAPSVTGIPIEVLFAIIGALVSLIYWDTRRQLNKLQSRGESRDRTLIRIQVALSIVCQKLNIPWTHDMDDRRHGSGD